MAKGAMNHLFVVSTIKTFITWIKKDYVYNIVYSDGATVEQKSKDCSRALPRS
jgi:hypothetical protein